MEKIKIAMIQICSGLDPVKNIEKIAGFLSEANKLKIKYIFLPECFYSLSDGVEMTPFLIAKQNEHYKNIVHLAKKFKVFLLGGSAATLRRGQVFNRSYNFSPRGEDLGHYDKRHLFSCELTPKNKKEASKKIIDEGILYTAGSTSKIIVAEKLVIGLSICFDLRYPHLYREYVLKGANLLAVPAAFTVPTGKAHWHVLLRARAIENQCFVVAAAQWGRHNHKIETFGHSLIIDPWGRVLADGGEGEKLVAAEIDLAQIKSVRQAIKL